MANNNVVAAWTKAAREKGVGAKAIRKRSEGYLAPLHRADRLRTLAAASAVATDVFEVQSYLRQQRGAAEVDALVAEGEDVYGPYQHLSQAFWSAEYHWRVPDLRKEEADAVVQAVAAAAGVPAPDGTPAQLPAVVDGGDILERLPVWFPFHVQLLTELLALPRYAELRDTTANNPVYSTLGYIEMDPVIKELLKEHMPPGLAGDSDDDGPPSPEDIVMSPEQQERARLMLRRGLNQATDRVHDAQRALRGCGMEPPTDEGVDPADYLALVAAYEKWGAAAFLDVVGHATKAAVGAATRTRGVCGRGRNYSRGANLMLVPTGELYRVHQPQLRRGFLLDLINARLPQATSYANGPGERGPIIQVVDESGSVQGEELRVIKAFATATADAARKFGRATRAVSFSSEARRYNTDEVAGRAAFMSSNMGGGTSFDEALAAARAEFEEGELREADILLLTDGDSTLRDPAGFLAWKRANGVRLFVLLTTDGHKSALSAVADFQATVADLTSVPAMEQSFTEFWRRLDDDPAAYGDLPADVKDDGKGGGQ